MQICQYLLGTRLLQERTLFSGPTKMRTTGLDLLLRNPSESVISKSSRYYGLGRRPTAECEARTVFFSKTLLSIDSWSLTNSMISFSSVACICCWWCVASAAQSGDVARSSSVLHRCNSPWYHTSPFTIGRVHTFFFLQASLFFIW